MREFELLDGDSGGTVFRDVIMLALAGFITLVLLLLPHLNPGSSAEAETRSPGNVIVELRWPDELDADLDLWVEGPDRVPVGYSNKGGMVFDLLRDDLGRVKDATELNYEFAYSRGASPGKYTVNVHLYRNRVDVYPVPFRVIVSLKGDAGGSVKEILSANLALARTGEELTVFRFELDEQGKLVSGSVHDLPRPLRSRGQS